MKIATPIFYWLPFSKMFMKNHEICGKEATMCGRKYASEELTWAEYHDMLNIVQPTSNLQPNYNIAPTHIMPVAIWESGQTVLKPMQWGLIPTWAKDSSRSYAMTNARAETLTEKPSFKNLLRSCRCAVLVSGFYEWQREGKSKQAHKVQRRDGKPMILAGLWADNPVLETTTYTIITTAATPEFEPIHHRLPAMIEPDQLSRWLLGSWNDASAMVQPYDGAIDAIPVSNDVGNVRNNHPELLAPLT